MDLQPIVDGSEILCFLLNEDGFKKVGEYDSNQYFSTSRSSASGTAKFSPDGNKYAIFNYYDNLHIYDFDRETGEISGHQFVELFDSDISEIRFGSVEWSPNSNFIYASSFYDLHQIELFENDFEVELIDEYNGTTDPVSTTFYLMSQGPDCRIYMCSFGGVNSYHVINNPDEKGAKCNFVQNQLKLPSLSGFASFPNFPRFRVDDIEKCDPGLVNHVSDIKIGELPAVKVIPNPSDGIVQLETGNIEVVSLQVVSFADNKILSDFSNYDLSYGEFDFSYLPAGLYILKLEDKDHKFYYSKMVIQ